MSGLSPAAASGHEGKLHSEASDLNETINRNGSVSEMVTTTPTRTEAGSRPRRPLIAEPHSIRAHELESWTAGLDAAVFAELCEQHRDQARGFAERVQALEQLREEIKRERTRHDAAVMDALRSDAEPPADTYSETVKPRVAVAIERAERARDEVALVVVDLLAKLRAARVKMPPIPPDWPKIPRAAIRIIEEQAPFSVEALRPELAQAVFARSCAVARELATNAAIDGQLVSVSETLDETGLSRRIVLPEVGIFYQQLIASPDGEIREQRLKAKRGETPLLRPWEAAQFDVNGRLAPCGLDAWRAIEAAEQVDRELRGPAYRKGI